jgi:ATP-dependent DNA helicase RecQ
MFKGGMGVNEIAKIRNLAVATIEGHLSIFIKSGEIDVSEITAPEKIPKIKDAVEKYGDDKLGPLKEVLGDSYSYGEIKAVITWMQAMKEK